MSSPFLPLLAALLVGLILGAFAAIFAGRTGRAAERQAASDAARQADARAAAELGALRTEYARLRDQAEAVRVAHARLETELQGERAAGQEKLSVVLGAREELSNQFKALANDILEENSKRFAAHNQSSIDQLLKPLGDRLGEFKQSVDGLQRDGIEGRSALRTQIDALRGMNEKLSSDANNLVKALKSSSKQQGDWGEVLLIGILENAGLRAGKEYRIQETFASEDGRQARPDIILNLPEGKHLVIDSKLSLTSYVDYCACDDDPVRKAHLEKHARSLRDHIDGLSKKAYQGLYQLRSLDFVIMFVPIEPAYLLALAHDESLWQRAWKKDVLLVSPGMLYPVLRTIAHIWQQERQTRNVEEIVRQGGALYDKVALFASTFEDVGKRISGAQNAFDKAFSQLSSGRGSVLSKIESLRRDTGLRHTKAMPTGMLGTEEGEDILEDADLFHASGLGSAGPQ